jgi:hypothetical protein
MKPNPYFSKGFKESELFSATNQYHLLDKMGNINQNKAFAQTILNETLTNLSQRKFEAKMQLTSHEPAASRLLLSRRSTRIQKSCFPLSQAESASTLITNFKTKNQDDARSHLQALAARARAS